VAARIAESAKKRPSYTPSYKGGHSERLLTSRHALRLRERSARVTNMRKTFTYLYFPFLFLAFALRVAMVWIARNSVMTPWSGGGDMDAYILLARNLVTGNGYTYARVPSAWRTPGYPLVIAGAMELFGTHFVIALRCLQVSLAVLAAYLCMRAARIFFGEMASQVTLLVALFLPTLAYFSGEILSESLTASLMAVFLWIFAEDSAAPRWTSAAGMGLAIGAGAMFRPNLAAVTALALTQSWLSRHTYRARLQLILIPLCAGLVFAPWIFRNYEVFGQFVLSTKSGADALCGALNPESRFNPGWENRMRSLVGSFLPNDLETNSPSRLALGSEIELNRKCWKATRGVWREMGWAALARWALRKWATYWLSTDQLPHPGNISRINRLLHVTAVAVYWVLLAMAFVGWWNLRVARPELAVTLLGYTMLMTLVHTPFVMDSRIRAPLIDPLLAVLAGGVVVSWAPLEPVRNDRALPSSAPTGRILERAETRITPARQARERLGLRGVCSPLPASAENVPPRDRQSPSAASLDGIRSAAAVSRATVCAAACLRIQARTPDRRECASPRSCSWSAS